MWRASGRRRSYFVVNIKRFSGVGGIVFVVETEQSSELCACIVFVFWRRQVGGGRRLPPTECPLSQALGPRGV